MDKTVIVYFHGYGSSPSSDKVRDLSQHFTVVAPSIPVKFDEAFAVLDNFLNNLDQSVNYVYVGTSMGGYWANLFSNLKMVPALLMNPCVDPAGTLGRFQNPELTPEELQKYSASKPGTAPKVVLLNEDDELLDYREAEAVFQGKAQVKTFKSGGHRFVDVNKAVPYINELATNSFYLP